MKHLLFFILFLSFLVSFGNQGWLKWYRLNRYGEVIERENQNLLVANNALRKEIEGLRDARYVEHYIRDELGFIRENEILFQSP